MDRSQSRSERNSLISNVLSLFCAYKFPVPDLAAVRQKLPESRAHLGEDEGRLGLDFANFPVFFPVSREFGAETGS